MPTINIRNVPIELARMVKATAASEGMTLREFVVGVLERDMKRGGWTAAKREVPAVNLSEVSMEALGGIAAGSFQAVVEREGKYPDIDGEIKMCGHRELNPTDGEMYVCRLAKHPKKVPHQPGKKVE